MPNVNCKDYKGFDTFYNAQEKLPKTAEVYTRSGKSDREDSIDFKNFNSVFYLLGTGSWIDLPGFNICFHHFCLNLFFMILQWE